MNPAISTLRDIVYQVSVFFAFGGIAGIEMSALKSLPLSASVFKSSC